MDSNENALAYYIRIKFAEIKNVLIAQTLVVYSQNVLRIIN